MLPYRQNSTITISSTGKGICISKPEKCAGRDISTETELNNLSKYKTTRGKFEKSDYL